MVPPDHGVALERYRRLAQRYDAATRLIAAKRLRAIALLRLASGDTVLDVACGTGAAFESLVRAVGPEGRVIGVEPCPEMMAIARQRCEALGLRNVTLVEASMEEARVPAPVDAALFSYAHDVLRSRRALDNVFAAVREGARIASVGAKLYPPALSFLNFWVRWRVRHYVSTLDGLDRPWSLLEQYVPDFRIAQVTWLGSGYIGAGTCSGAKAMRAA